MREGRDGRKSLPVASLLDGHAAAVGAVVLLLVVAGVHVELDASVEHGRVDVPAAGADRVVSCVGKRPVGSLV